MGANLKCPCNYRLISLAVRSWHHCLEHTAITPAEMLGGLDKVSLEGEDGGEIERLCWAAVIQDWRNCNTFQWDRLGLRH